MSAITTQILDTASGKPGAGIAVFLERKTHSAGWQAIAEGITDADGRVDDLLSPRDVFLPGHYRLIFEIGPYYLLESVECFFPQVTISFVVKDSMKRYYIPLQISPFGYSTYRGA